MLKAKILKTLAMKNLTVFRIENDDLEDISNEEFNDYNYTQISALDELNNLIGLEQVKEATNQFINVARINKIKRKRYSTTLTFNAFSICR